MTRAQRELRLLNSLADAELHLQRLRSLEGSSNKEERFVISKFLLVQAEAILMDAMEIALSCERAAEKKAGAA